MSALACRVERVARALVFEVARDTPCSGTFVASAWLEDARVAAVSACQYAEKRGLFNPSAQNLALSATVRRVSLSPFKSNSARHAIGERTFQWGRNLPGGMKTQRATSIGAIGTALSGAFAKTGWPVRRNRIGRQAM